MLLTAEAPARTALPSFVYSCLPARYSHMLFFSFSCVHTRVYENRLVLSSLFFCMFYQSHCRSPGTRSVPKNSRIARILSLLLLLLHFSPYFSFSTAVRAKFSSSSLGTSRPSMALFPTLKAGMRWRFYFWAEWDRRGTAYDHSPRHISCLLHLPRLRCFWWLSPSPDLAEHNFLSSYRLADAFNCLFA